MKVWKQSMHVTEQNAQITDASMAQMDDKQIKSKATAHIIKQMPHPQRLFVNHSA